MDEIAQRKKFNPLDGNAWIAATTYFVAKESTRPLSPLSSPFSFLTLPSSLPSSSSLLPPSLLPPSSSHPSLLPPPSSLLPPPSSLLPPPSLPPSLLPLSFFLILNHREEHLFCTTMMATYKKLFITFTLMCIIRNCRLTKYQM